MKGLWHAFLRRAFPGTLEEYYAARALHFTEVKVYRRRVQFIVGLVGFGGPLMFLLISDLLPFRWKILLLVPLAGGVICLCDTIAEHYALRLLRLMRERRSG